MLNHFHVSKITWPAYLNIKKRHIFCTKFWWEILGVYFQNWWSKSHLCSNIETLEFLYIHRFSTILCLLTLKCSDLAHFSAWGIIFLLVVIYLSYVCPVIVNTWLWWQKKERKLTKLKITVEYPPILKFIYY